MIGHNKDEDDFHNNEVFTMPILFHNNKTIKIFTTTHQSYLQEGGKGRRQQHQAFLQHCGQKPPKSNCQLPNIFSVFGGYLLCLSNIQCVLCGQCMNWCRNVFDQDLPRRAQLVGVEFQNHRFHCLALSG